MVALGSITFIVATMGINIVANFVSPAYDISNLYPEKIDFRIGGLIASILSVLVCPWIFVSSPQAITIFVSIFGAALGPMFGIMVADYYLVKRQQVVVEDLYRMSPNGSLYFEDGWNLDGAARARGSQLSFRSGCRFGGLWRHRQCRGLGMADRRRIGCASYMMLMRRAVPLARTGERGVTRRASLIPRRRRLNRGAAENPDREILLAHHKVLRFPQACAA